MGLASKKEEAQTIVTKKGETFTIEAKPSPNSFSNLVRSQFGEPIKLIAKDKTGAEVGRLVYMPDGGPIDVFVAENKRRQGIGNALYDAFEKQGGKLPSINSGVAISDEARALRSSRAAGKAGLMAAALGGAGGASAAEIAESFLPLGMTPSTLAPGTLTPEQKAASDEAYRRKLAEERAAKMKAQALLRSGVKQEEPQMAKGGMMARNIPGFQEGGANVDPVSGNEVPTGSMPEEVRDDIDAKLSPGEFVLPADVVRFIGLERLMKMRDEAKKGLQRMSDIGQMGNADEVGEASNGTYEDAGFESEIDDILSEIEAEENGRDVNEQTEVMMAQGGFMKSGTDLTKAPKNPVFDVRYYKNAEGSVMYITHINGKPMTPIPEGYKAVTQEEAQKVGQKAEEAAKAVQTTNEVVAMTHHRLIRLWLPFWMKKHVNRKSLMHKTDQRKALERNGWVRCPMFLKPLLSGQHLMAP
jgi:Arc/MetJ-type ribon-helix-helix transcriptional regulator